MRGYFLGNFPVNTWSLGVGSVGGGTGHIIWHFRALDVIEKYAVIQGGEEAGFHNGVDVESSQNLCTALPQTEARDWSLM